jgi:RHS repeat-associated protein
VFLHFSGRRFAGFTGAVALGVSIVLAVSVGVGGPAFAVSTPLPTPAPTAAQPEATGYFTAPDPVSAQVDARSKHRKIEVLSELTDSSTTWANPNGTFTTQSFGSPIRVADSSQASGWRDLDYTLQENADGSVSPKSSYFPITLSGAASAAQVAKSGVVAVDAASSSTLSLGWVGALPQPVLSGVSATYDNVEPNMNLVVSMTATGFEESYVFTAKPSAGELALTLPLTNDDVTATQASNGAVDFENAKKKIASVGNAVMWDSRVDSGSGLPVDEVAVPVAAGSATAQAGAADTPSTGSATSTSPVSSPASSNSDAISLAVPSSFFDDPDVVYPVTVDPTITISDDGDTYVRSDYPSTTYSDATELQVGTYNGGTSVARAYLNFSTAGWGNEDVTAATLKLYQFHSYNCTASKMWVYPSGTASSSTDWSNRPAANTSYEGNVTASKGYDSSCSAGWVDISVHHDFAYLASEGLSKVAVQLRADSETADSSWKRFNSTNATSDKPSLVVTYNRYPSAATAPTMSPSATSGSTLYTSSTTPTFTSSVVDADGGTTDARFEVDSDTSGTAVESCTTGMVAESTDASCTLATPLTDGTTYYVRALGNDGTDDSEVCSGGSCADNWSTYQAFKVEAALPPTPSVSCPGYAMDSWTDTVPSSAVSCTVSVAAPAYGQSPTSELDVQVDGGAVTPTVVTVGSSGTASASVPDTPGPHSVSATAVAPSGTSAETFYEFGYGGAAMTSPAAGTKTNDIVRLSASGPPAGSSTVTAALKWRPANSGTSLWNTDTTDTLPVVDTGAAETVSDFAWSTTSATTDTTTGSTVTLDPRLPALLELEICFTYSPGGTKCTADVDDPLTVLRVPHAFGGGFPVESAGDGQVALWTGELELDATDVSVSTPAGSLSVSRTHSSFAGPQDAETGVFGDGWSASFAGDGAGATSDQVVDSTTVDGTITLIDPDLGTQTFREPGDGTSPAPAGDYTAVDDATAQSGSQLSVTGSGSSRVLAYTTLDGTVTSWAPLDGSATPIQWVPVSVAQAGAQGTETYTTDASGRVTQILAPLPDGVTCTSGALEAGCSALQIAYALSTTATSETPGDYLGHVSSITYETYDPASSAMVFKVMATYLYDTSGRLVSVTDPQTDDSTPAVDYTYTTESGDTLVTSTSTPGMATTTYNYSSDTGDVRLASVSEGGATSGAASSTQSAYVYGIDPSTSGLPALDSATTAKWGQTDAPTTGYAVFGADYPGTIDTDDSATLVAESGWSSGDWKYADLDYTDADGYEINTADYGAGEWLRTENSYDVDGNLTGSLDATDIDAAVAENLDGAALSDQTVTRYNAADPTIDGVATTLDAGTYVTDDWSAPFLADLDGDGTQTLVRTHTHYDYDQGAPDADVNPDTGDPYLLQTTVTVGVSTVDGASADPSISIPTDLATTSETEYGYDPIDGAAHDGDTSGWTLGEPTVTTTVMPGSGNNIVSKVLYDSNGNVVQTVAPLSDGSDAGTTVTVTYTAGTNTADSDCGDAPQWVGLPCWSGPAAAPSDAGTVAPIAADHVTGYNLWLEPTEDVQTSGTATRTTDLTYLPDGRQSKTTVATVGLSGSTAIPESKVLYDSTTHLQDGTASLDGSGDVTSSDTSTVDLWGRTTSYTNSLGDTTTTTYVPPQSPGAGQVATVVTPSGASSTETSTYTYDGTDADGNLEHRGLPTGLSVTGVGSFTAAYDKDGNLITQDMPAGLSEAWEYNDQGQLSSLTYSGDVTTDSGTATGSWLSYARTYDAAGRVSTESTPEGGTDLTPTGYANAYTYDQAGRLSNVVAAASDETGTVSCTDREYSFDKQGDRTDLNTASGTGTSCPSAGSGAGATYAYDSFSRQTTGANGSGSYSYDAFGRQTTVPGADSPDGGGDITLSYFDTDAVHSIAQTTAGVADTTTFTLDPDGRRLTSTEVNGSTTTVTTNHYSDDSDNPTWSSQTSGSSTTDSSYLPTLGSASAVVTTNSSGTTASLSLADLAGSVVASVTVPGSGDASGITGFSSFDEYGNPTSTGADTGVNDYGWEGSAQRAVTSTGLILMGARVYSQKVGGFTSVDAVLGGNANVYGYPDDPVNESDTTGDACVGKHKWEYFWWGVETWYNSCQADTIKVELEWSVFVLGGGGGVGTTLVKDERVVGVLRRASFIAIAALITGAIAFDWAEGISRAMAKHRGVVDSYNWFTNWHTFRSQ